MGLYSVFLTSLFVSMVLIAVLMRYAKQLKLVDVPDHRKVHTSEIPRIGGIGMVLGVVTSVLLWIDITSDISVFLGGILVITIFGLWDDRSELSYKLKFAGQLLAILIVVLPGNFLIDKLSFLGNESLPHWFSVPLTVFFLLGMTNAMNLSDGLDGLASGLSLLSLACIMLIAALADSYQILLLSVAIIGATLGFLRYNTHPAMVFMGDTGSQFLGFGLGVLSIWTTQKANTAVSPELPLMILGLPIVDTLSVMVSRIAHGKSPFKPDKTHFHHRLLSLGFSHYQVVLVLYFVQSTFVVLAYVMRYESSYVIMSVYFALFLAAALFYPVSKHFGWEVSNAKQVTLFGGLGKLINLRYEKWLAHCLYYCIAILLFCFLVAGAAMTRGISKDLQYYSIIIVVASVVVNVLENSLRISVKRLTIYTGAILVVYSLSKQFPVDIVGGYDWMKSFVALLAILIAIGMRFSGGYYFSITPSDYLVMFILVSTAYLPIFKEVNIAKIAIEVAVLQYGIEFILRRKSYAANIVWSGAIICFILIGGRVFFDSD